MNSKVVSVLMVAICALLGVGLLMTHNQAQAEKERSSARLRQMEEQLKNSDAGQIETLKAQIAQLQTRAQSATAATPTTSPAPAGLQEALTKAQEEAKAAQEAVAKAQQAAVDAQKMLAAEKQKSSTELAAAAEKMTALEKSKTQAVTERDTKIQELNSQTSTLKRTVSDLNDQMGRLQINIDQLKDQITTTQKELAGTKSDKEFLMTELKRMQGEKESMEKQMNDLEYVREQLSRLKSEQNVARRLDWMRKGVLHDNRKGAQVLMDSIRRPTTRRTPPEEVAGSKVDVELHKDGTVSIRPATSAPAEPAPEKK